MSGSCVERGDRHRQLLGQCARKPAAYADFEAELADMLIALPTAATGAAAQHRVARDAPPDPSVIDPVTDLDHDSAPLVTEPHREPGMAFVQVGHLAGEELDVGTTDTDPLDVDDHLACGC